MIAGVNDQPPLSGIKVLDLTRILAGTLLSWGAQALRPPDPRALAEVNSAPAPVSFL
jgi:hypothetical protein